jgi:hypothetical protein
MQVNGHQTPLKFNEIGKNKEERENGIELSTLSIFHRLIRPGNPIEASRAFPLPISRPS